MNILVDTSVWSLALRRAPAPRAPEVVRLDACLERGDVIVATGTVLQELLQGFQGPAQAERIVKRFSLLPVIAPEVEDPIEAAALRNRCRRNGVHGGAQTVQSTR